MQSSDNQKRIKMQAFLRGKAQEKAQAARQAKAEEIAATANSSGHICPASTSVTNREGG